MVSTLFLNGESMTLNDVARHAGVALDTARKALRDDTTVRPYIKELVVKAAAELDYKPNLVARALKQQALRLVPISIIDLVNPYFGSLASNLSRCLCQNGLEPALCLEVDRLLHLSRSLSTCASIMAYGYDAENLKALSRLQKVVTVNRQVVLSDIDNVANVRIDFVPAYRNAIDALLKSGHKRVAVCSDWLARYSQTGMDSGKFEVVVETLHAHGLQPISCEGRPFFGSPMAVAAHIEAHPDAIDVVFCDNDVQAGIIYGEATALGLRVPGDLAIIGCDATQVLNGMWSVKIETQVLAEQTVDLLRMLLDGAKHIEERVYRPELVDHRGSLVGGGG